MSTREERYLTAKRALFHRYYGAKLNDCQREAVCTENGPLLVLAGAGSGKTTVLVRRIVHLIRYGDAYSTDFVPSGLTEDTVLALERAAASAPLDTVEEILPEFIHAPCPPRAILAITFTNKAAGEIRDRLAAAFDDPAISSEIWAGTFHSICLRILRVHAAEAGYQPGFSIYDTDDTKRITSEIMKNLEIDEKYLPIKSVLHDISEAKDRLIGPEDFEDHGDFRRRQIAKVYAAYQKRLEEANAMDFDDIIRKTVLLLENHPEIAKRYQDKFRYVCIDEYQDTNYAQFRLSVLLGEGRRNIMVVGDDDQSIYRFRGATVANILNFDKTYPDAKVIKLEQNYRSTKNILAAANAVIAHNSERHDKTLWCAGEEGAKLSLHKCDTQIEEAVYIKEKIMETVVRERRRYRDMAILYRVNEMSRSLEGVLAKSGIPYRICGGQRFYDRKEIRDMIAYLHILANPNDNLRLTRIINEPKRKIGDSTIEAVAAIAAAEGRSMSAVLVDAARYPTLAKSAPRLLAFCELITELMMPTETLAEQINNVFEKTGYHAMLTAEGETGKTRIDNVGELISAAAEYEKRAGEEASLVGFLEEVALVSDVDKYDENADAVVLMTIHSAKGLEFPIVFLPGMEEGIFPGSQVNQDPGELNEERRLAYVAITRAKERIYITHTRERMIYGRTSINPLSRFVREEIPASLIENTTVERAKPAPERRSFSPMSRPEKTLSQEFLRQPTRPTGSPAATARPTRFAPGTRVRHPLFGAGKILAARDMGGDILYEVAFDSGSTKKLMATYAKLTPAE